MKELRARTCTTSARWMYDPCIPLNAVNYDSFNTAIEAIRQYGSIQLIIPRKIGGLIFPLNEPESTITKMAGLF